MPRSQVTRPDRTAARVAALFDDPQMTPPAPIPAAAAQQPSAGGFAPDQKSDLVVRVCSFCGSGHLIGNSDGSISCGYCEATFTITVMPSHPFQPMVNPEDGSPFVMPTDPTADPNPQIGRALPDGSVDPTPGPAEFGEQTPPGQPDITQDRLPQGDPDGAPLQPGLAPSGTFAAPEAAPGAPGVPGERPEDAVDPSGDPEAESTGDDDSNDDDLPDFLKKKKSHRFITREGVALTEDAYVAHLRRTVLGQRC